MIKTPASKTSEQELDEALTGTFPASDPVALGHSEHAGDPVRTNKPAPAQLRESQRQRPSPFRDRT